MTFKIPKSAIIEVHDRGIVIDFAATITAYCSELNDWRQRENEVDAQPELEPRPDWAQFASHDDPATAYVEANRAWSEKKILHKDRYPRPVAFNFIERCVRYDDNAGKFVEDYEIINDDPSDEQILRSKKDGLLANIIAARDVAMSKFKMPPGKVALYSIVENRVMAADLALMKKLSPTWTEEQSRDIDFTNSEIDKNRTEADRKFLAEKAEREAKLSRLEFDVAHAMSDVEDLTTETVDSYVIPSLV
ncbi:hypothetical protein A1D31_11810 [Bradyrhizobium liaoningense]|nr:hypothetical protein A1D31_11810 [Bradyrhizobium liaoningense]